MLYKNSGLLNLSNNIYYQVEDFNNYFSSNTIFSSLFNQVSYLSVGMANVTVLQQLKDAGSFINQNVFALMLAEGIFKENLFSFALAIIAIAFFGKLYSSSTNLAFQIVAKTVQFFIYMLLLVVLQFVLSSLFIEGNFTNAATYLFEVLLLAVILFLSTVMISTSLIGIKSFEVPVLIYLVASFGGVLLNTNDLALFIICIEGFSLTLYVLATTSRTFGGITASIKYFAFGTLGSLMLYGGAINMFEMVHTMNFSFFASVLNFDKAIGVQSLILTGLLIKLGAAPFHQGIADVYSGVSLLVTAFYSTFVKFTLFLLFVQFAINFISTNDVEYTSLLSLIVGSFITLKQTDIKRFLAGGSITHTGYLLAGDLTGSYIYVLTYVLTSILLFSVLLTVKLNDKELAYISDMRFVGRTVGAQRFIVLCVLASMAGLPPFAGFYGKFFVWSSLIEDTYLYNDKGSFILFLVGILTSLIVMFYYIYMMYTLFASNDATEAAVISNTLTTPRVMEYLSNLGFSVRYSQYFNVATTVLWTFIICNLLFLIG